MPTRRSTLPRLRVKGTSEQLEDILAGTASMAAGASAASAISRPKVDRLEDGMRLLARHLDHLRAFVIKNHVQGIPNLGLAPESYWTETVERTLGVAILEEPAPPGTSLTPADLDEIRGVWAQAQAYDSPHPIQRHVLKLLLALHLTQILDAAEVGFTTWTDSPDFLPSDLVEIRKTWQAAQAHDSDPIERSSLLKLLGRHLTPLLDLAQAGLSQEVAAPSL